MITQRRTNLVHTNMKEGNACSVVVSQRAKVLRMIAEGQIMCKKFKPKGKPAAKGHKELAKC